MPKFVCFLPISQSRASFLYVFTSHLQRLTLTTLRDVYRELVVKGGCMGDAHGVMVAPLGYWGIFRLGIACGLRTSFLMESMKQLVGSTSAAAGLPLLPVPQLHGSFSILAGVRKK